MKKERPRVPEHWKQSSWEAKAKENPLFAVMTTVDMVNAGNSNFTDEHLDQFFKKGKILFTKHVLPIIQLSGFSKEESLIIEYGCGAGRILNAVVENDFSCAGIDISPTMLGHCRKLVPAVKSLHLCAPATGKTDLPDGVASVVYSYAVLQHISTLTAFRNAVREMCRLLRSKGVLALQVNCEDFVYAGFERPGRTENFETYSLHWKHGERKPYHQHQYDNWSGVYIGYETLKDLLSSLSLTVYQRYYHNETKKRAIWVVATKK
jgi:SAM-dependent methyltransferase